GNIVTSRQHGIADEVITLAQLKRHNSIPLQTIMHERACLDLSGTFDETLNVLPVWDFTIRLAEHYPIHHIKYGVTSECRFYDSGQDSAAAAREAARIYERYGMRGLRSTDEWHTAAAVEKAISLKDWSLDYFLNESDPSRPRSMTSYDVV